MRTRGRGSQQNELLTVLFHIIIDIEVIILCMIELNVF